MFGPISRLIFPHTVITMKNHAVRLLIILATALCLISPLHAQQVQTVNSFDLNRYLGTWHEIARFPAWYQRGCSNSKAVYGRIDNKTISVTNSCDRNGKRESADGNAIVKGTGKLGVKFSPLQPFRADYWVLWIDDAYQTVAVGEPGKKYGWILSRNKSRSRASVSGALNALQENGYDTNKLIWN